MAPVLVPLRPSSEHILIVRAPGARDQHGCASNPFLSWGLCEQGGNLAAPFPLPGRKRGLGLAVPHVGAGVSVDQLEYLSLDDRLG
jgi:hypothetical protein